MLPQCNDENKKNNSSLEQSKIERFCLKIYVWKHESDFLAYFFESLEEQKSLRNFSFETSHFQNVCALVFIISVLLFFIKRLAAGNEF